MRLSRGWPSQPGARRQSIPSLSPPFTNATVRYKLTDLLPQAISRELIARTRYQVITDPTQADAVLSGTVINYVAYPTLIDQATGRTSGLQVIVRLQVSLVERATGKVIFTRPNFEVHERYELSVTNNTAVFRRERRRGGTPQQGRLARRGERDPGEFLSPEQFLQRIQKAPPAPVYLFLGPEVYQLGACRRALVDKMLAPEDRENGLSRHDLEETTLGDVLDDARSLVAVCSESRSMGLGRRDCAAARAGRQRRRKFRCGGARRLSEAPHSRHGAGLRSQPLRFRGRGPRQDRTRAEVLLRDSGGGRTAAVHARIGAPPGAGLGEGSRPANRPG